MKVKTMNEWNIDNLWPEVTPEIFDDIRTEASKWNSATDDMFGLRNNLNRKISNSSSRESEMSFNTFLNQSLNYLDEIEITPSLPTEIYYEREEYRDLLTKSIDLNRDLSVFSDIGMTKHSEEIMTTILDYAEGPIRAYWIIDNLNNGEELSTQKSDTMGLTSKFYTSFETSREQRRRRMKKLNIPVRRPRDKIVGEAKYGAYPGRIGRLVFGLHEYIQPKEQMLGVNNKDATKTRNVIERKLHQFVDARETLRDELEGTYKIEKILLESDDIIDMMADEIKPRSILDLVSAHPLQLKFRYMIREDEELLERNQQLLDLYMIVSRPGCSQAIIYDIIDDVIFGNEKERLWIFNQYQTQFGYLPIPGYESLSARRVINPRSTFELGSFINRMNHYEVSPQPSSMIA